MNLDNKTDKKKIKLQEAGRELFWKFGFKKVSVEEICKRAGVSRMTFYRMYDNKIMLAKDILDNVIDESIKRFKSLMAESESVEEKMRHIVLMKVEGTKEISREFIEDMYGHSDSVLRDYMLNKTRETWRVLIEAFRTAQDEGWMRKDFKPEFLLSISMKMVEMLQDEKMMAMYNSPQELILEMTKMMVYGIVAREENENVNNIE